METRYQYRLEVMAVLVMSFMMFLFGASFLLAPNITTFQRLSALGINISPVGFAIACFVGMVGYPLLLSRNFRKLMVELKEEIFMIYSAPVLFYFLVVAVDQLSRRPSLTPVIYFSIYLLIILLALFVYSGYDRRLEWVACVIMAALMAVAASVFYTMGFSTFDRFNTLYGTHFAPVQFAVLCSLCALGYVLTPLVRRGKRHQRWLFIGFSVPVMIFAVLTLTTVSSGTSVLGTLSVFNWESLIVLLGCAIYRSETTSRLTDATAL